MNDKLPDNIGPRSHLPDYLTIKYSAHKGSFINLVFLIGLSAISLNATVTID